MPSASASLSAMSFSISPSAFAISSPIPGSRGIKLLRLLTIPPGDNDVDVEPEPLVEVEMRFWPTPEVLSWMVID